MEIVKKKINEVTPYWRNPRNNDGAVEVVKKSIKKYGYNIPILIDKDNVIISGHVRYKALKQLGVEDIDCVIFNGSEKQANEFRIVDNKTSELAEWNEESLIKELRDLDVMSVQDFFSDDLNSLLSKSVGVDPDKFDYVEDKDMNDAKKNIDKQFKNKERRLVRFICPNCEEEFELEYVDVKMKLGIE